MGAPLASVTSRKNKIKLKIQRTKPLKLYRHLFYDDYTSYCYAKTYLPHTVSICLKTTQCENDEKNTSKNTLLNMFDMGSSVIEIIINK